MLVLVGYKYHVGVMVLAAVDGASCGLGCGDVPVSYHYGMGAKRYTLRRLAPERGGFLFIVWGGGTGAGS